MKRMKTRVAVVALLTVAMALVVVASISAAGVDTQTARSITAADNSLTIDTLSMGNAGAIHGNVNYWTSPVDGSGTFEWFNQDVSVTNFSFPDTGNGIPVFAGATIAHNIGSGYGPRTAFVDPYRATLEGVYSIIATGTDGAGDVSGEITPAFGIDKQDPVVTTNVLPFYAGTPTVTLNATDTMSGVESVLITHNSQRLYSYEPNPLDPGNFSVGMSFVGSGIHAFKWTAFDNAGNAVSGTEMFTIDNTAPTTTSNALAVYNGPATITLTAVDNPGGSGVANTYYMIDGNPQVIGTTVSEPAPVSGSATHTLEFWSDDAVGNVETPHNTVSFSVVAAPVISTVYRLGGSDRYVGSANTAKDAYPNWTGVTDVVLASGEDRAQPDALAAAGLAGVLDAPLMIVPYSSMNASIRDAIQAMPAGVDVHIVGGTGSVSTTVQNQINGYTNVGAVDRVSGADRYSTAAAVARRMSTELVAQGSSLPATALITNGNMPSAMFDALTASAVSAHNFYPVLLVTDTAVPSATTNVLTDLGLSDRWIIGGTSSVSDGVRNSLGVPSTKRIYGPDRYSTATAVAMKAKSMGWLTNSLVGFASAVPDAATGGAYMGKKDGALVYVQPNAVPGATSSYLTGAKATIDNGVVFGGTLSVSESVRTQLLNLIK